MSQHSNLSPLYSPTTESGDADKKQNKSGKALGRGLSSLLGPSSNLPTLDKKEGLSMLPLTALKAGVYQPRVHFDEKEMNELADSIRERGVLQPILVRPTGNVDKFDNPQYEIIAGERRWRASKQAGRKTIPVVIKHLTDKQTLECGLIENIQRHDLNPIEEAIGYESLMSDFKYTQEMLSKTLGKSRSHVANTLRLLTLPKKIQTYVQDRKISAGHGRTLINCDRAEEFTNLILKESLSVRQTESLISDYNNKPFNITELPNLSQLRSKKTKSSSISKMSIQNEDITALENELSNAFSLKSKIITKPDQSGHVQIQFRDPTELDKLMNLIFGVL